MSGLPRRAPGVIGPHALVVLRLAANGMTNAEIAELVGRSRETVKTHMSIVCRSLGARDRSNAVAVALRIGLLRLEDIRLPELLSASDAGRSDHGSPEKGPGRPSDGRTPSARPVASPEP